MKTQQDTDSKFVKMFDETVNVQTGHFETTFSW